MSNVKKHGLGRGLGALMPTAPAAPAAPAAAAPVEAAPARPVEAARRTYFAAGIDELYPSPEQPRRKFEPIALQELAESIRAHGVVTPLVVRPRPEGGGYFLIAGERRWRAAQKAGVHEVPVVVQEVSEQEAFERALVENVQREDLGPLEEAAAYQRLIDEFGMTQEAVAIRMGKDRSTIANAVRLLRLPSGVRQLVEDGALSMGHARALLPLVEAGDLPATERTARVVVDKGMSVRATEALVKKVRAPVTRELGSRPKPGKSASVRDLEERLTRSLGGPVTITEDTPGKAGTIEIRYLDLDHLDRLLDRLL